MFVNADTDKANTRYSAYLNHECTTNMSDALKPGIVRHMPSACMMLEGRRQDRAVPMNRTSGWCKACVPPISKYGKPSARIARLAHSPIEARYKAAPHNSTQLGHNPPPNAPSIQLGASQLGALQARAQG